MDNRNVFVAIALSMAVLLFWGAFFETPRQVKENNEESSSDHEDEESTTFNSDDDLTGDQAQINKDNLQENTN